MLNNTQLAKKDEQSRRKYRIAYLTHGARNIGGGEYTLYSLIKNLRRDIFEPMIFYSQENEILKRLREDGLQLVQVPLSKKITSVYRDEIRKNPISLFVYFCNMLSGVFKIRELLKQYKIDILHPHDNLSKIMGGVAVKLTGGQIVAHCHDLLQESLIDRLLMFYQLIFMDRIIAVSDSVKGLFMVFGRIPAKVCMIHNGIDIKDFNNAANPDLKKELGINNEDVVIGVIAVFDACKGHIYLFQAIKKIVSEGTNNLVCLVIGDGRIDGELKEFVKNEGLEEYIRFLGYKSNIAELLTIIDIVVIPSLQESLGMTALEAMAMKVSVVATNVGGLPESIENGKTGILVPPKDVESLSGAIKYMIEHPEIRKKMGEAGRSIVENKFSLENNVRKTEEIYLNVLKANKEV